MRDRIVIELRRKRYFKLSSQIAQLDNAQLRSLFDDSESSTSSSGWGINQAIVLGQSKVFVKRLPVTNIEYDNLFSTKNLYDLPTYCNRTYARTLYIAYPIPRLEGFLTLPLARKSPELLLDFIFFLFFIRFFFLMEGT